MRSKFTNIELYHWHVHRLNDLYLRAYEQAVEIAGLARECFAFELGDPTIARPPKSWDRTKSGLMAAETLSQYLRDLDFQYKTRRIYDRLIIQHVPLCYAAPIALANLIASRSTGVFTISRWWFKRLYPGIRKRRIRSIAVSIPCISGAFASVNATLRYTGGDKTPSTAVSLSSANMDYGWDMSRRAESYVPFEGISLDADTTWELTFPEGRDIDTSTIADVVLTIEYTAMEGSDEPQPPASAQLFVDLARMVPDVWSKLRKTTDESPVAFDVASLVPGFLHGCVPAHVDKLIILDDAGMQRSDLLKGVVDQATNRVVLTPLRRDVPWGEVHHILLVVKVDLQP